MQHSIPIPRGAIKKTLDCNFCRNPAFFSLFSIRLCRFHFFIVLMPYALFLGWLVLAIPYLPLAFEITEMLESGGLLTDQQAAAINFVFIFMFIAGCLFWIRNFRQWPPK